MRGAIAQTMRIIVPPTNNATQRPSHARTHVSGTLCFDQFDTRDCVRLAAPDGLRVGARVFGTLARLVFGVVQRLVLEGRPVRRLVVLDDDEPDLAHV